MAVIVEYFDRTCLRCYYTSLFYSRLDLRSRTKKRRQGSSRRLSEENKIALLFTSATPKNHASFLDRRRAKPHTLTQRSNKFRDGFFAPIFPPAAAIKKTLSEEGTHVSNTSPLPNQSIHVAELGRPALSLSLLIAFSSCYYEPCQ